MIDPLTIDNKDHTTTTTTGGLYILERKLEVDETITPNAH
jgi:hypothetical protein